MLLVAVACGGVLFEFRTLFGRDAGVAMLVVFMALKLLELRSRRDATVVVTLGYFLLLTHYFYSQSIPTGLWLLAAMTLLTATLIRLHGGPLSTAGATLRYAGLLTLQAIPFMLVLYLLFPRVAGPLWGLPQDAHSGRSGLSDQMTPGNIANLALSSEIAFRVRFADPLPPATNSTGAGRCSKATTASPGSRTAAAAARRRSRRCRRRSPTKRPSSRTSSAGCWRSTHPTALAPEFALSGTLTATSREPLSQRQRFALSATLDYRFNTDEEPATLRRNLALPPESNPRSPRPGRILESCGHRPRPPGAEGTESLFRREIFLHAATAAARRTAGR